MSRYKGKHRVGNTEKVQYHTGGLVHAGRVVFPSPIPPGTTQTVYHIGDLMPGDEVTVTVPILPHG